MDDEPILPSAADAARWLVKAEQDLAVAALVLHSPIGANWDALDELAPWAVAGRYPEDLPNPSHAVTAQLVEHARAVTAMVGGLLGGALGPSE